MIGRLGTILPVNMSRICDAMKSKCYDGHPYQLFGGAKTSNNAIKISLFILLFVLLPKAQSYSKENVNYFLKIYPDKSPDLDEKEGSSLHTDAVLWEHFLSHGTEYNGRQHNIINNLLRFDEGNNFFHGKNIENNSHFFRIKRSTQSEQIQCPLSKEKLLEAKRGMLLTNCELGETETDYCIAWLTLIQCGADFLKRGVEGKGNDQISKWETLYNDIVFRYERDGEKVRESLPGRLVKQFDVVRADLENVKRVINDIKSVSEKNQIKMCVEYISSGNIDNAIKYFKQIRKNSVLVDITKSSYTNHGELENLKNIVAFGKALPTCSQNMIVYVSLFDLIKASNKLNSPHMIIFQKGMDRCLRNSSIEMALKSRTDDLFNSWGSRIRSSDFNDITEFLGENYDYVREFYPQIIEKAYANNLENFRNILKFIQDSPYIEDECMLLVSLYNNLHSNNDLDSYETVKLAYRLKEVMEMTNYPTIKDIIKDFAETLKNSLGSLKQLIWNGNRCTIKNKRWGHYLYAADNDRAYDSDRRRVFAWRDGSTVRQGYWKFEPESRADHFIVKNLEHGEYLYAASDQFKPNTDRRTLFTWRPGSAVIQGRWQFTTVENGKYFAIRNVIHEEYLYEASEDWALDSERARVFTWAGANKTSRDDTMTWEISCYEG